MTLQRIVDRLGQRGWLARLNVLALSLGLIAVGYGIFEPPEHPPPTWSQASAALPASSAAVAEPQAVSPAGAAAARVSEAGTFAAHEVGIEAPRACAPDRGITEACIYN